MESYEQKYKAALEWMRGMYGGLHGKTKGEAEKYFPELAESEDERIRKSIIAILNNYVDNSNTFKPKMLAWLEKQVEQKPFDYENATIIQKDFAPKEVTFTQEVETGNGNIKALVTEKLDSTNTSTEDDVRRKSIIWVLEYARGLNTFNRYGKENIDKDISWLEKQGKPMWTEEDEEELKIAIETLHEAGQHSSATWLKSLKQRLEGQQ